MPPLRRDKPVPLYYQIEVALRRAIESGQLPEGKLPTEEELVERYQVSRMTVRSALGRLEEDGLIERRRGRGTFVAPGATAKIERHPDRLLGFEEDLKRQGADPRVEVLTVEEIEPPLATARILGLGPGETTYRVRRLGRVNGEPFWLESRYYAPAAGAKMLERDLSGASLSRSLEDTLGVRVAAADLRIEATAANQQQARYLNVRRGHPLLVYQIAFNDTAGSALEVLRTAFPGDRYAISVHLPNESASAEEDPFADSFGGSREDWAMGAAIPTVRSRERVGVVLEASFPEGRDVQVEMIPR